MAEQITFRFSEVDFGAILTELISVDTITDIELRYNEVWIVDIRRGRYRYDLTRHTQAQREELTAILYKLPRQIAIRMEAAYNEGRPILDGESVYREIGQLRINAIHESLTDSAYPGIAIRKTLYGLRLNDEKVLQDNYATADFFHLVEVLLCAGCNVMFAGLTGAGKTELLRYVARYIPPNDAIITIEDTFEAYLKRIYPAKDVLALKTSDTQGFPELIRACLRQNPDWILVSETRGKEVVELLEAVGTGHHLISTIHADSAHNIPNRMLEAAKVEGAQANRMFHQIHQNINLGVYIHYYNDDRGSHRQVTEVCEYYLEDGEPRSHMLYWYDYQTETYKAEQIRSRVIRSKVIRSRVSCRQAQIFFEEDAI